MRLAADEQVTVVTESGPGPGVFPARMMEVDWTCTALDPDPRAAALAREVIGIAAGKDEAIRQMSASRGVH